MVNTGNRFVVVEDFTLVRCDWSVQPIFKRGNKFGNIPWSQVES